MSKKTRGDKGHKARKKTRDKRTTKADLIPQWIVVILGVAKREGHQILTDVQYDHEVSVLKRLTNFSDAEEIADLKIEKIGSFYELKDKGGPLGKINLRLYFGALVDKREIVVAKAYKKEADRQTPPHIILIVEHRLDEYRRGRLRKGATVYQATSKERRLTGGRSKEV